MGMGGGGVGNNGVQCDDKLEKPITRLVDGVSRLDRGP